MRKTPAPRQDIEHAEFVRERIRADIESAEHGRSRRLSSVLKDLRRRIAKAKKTARAR